MNLRPVVDSYDPAPDVVVVDVAQTLDERYADRFYLAAEVVSESDRARVGQKRDVYKLLRVVDRGSRETMRDLKPAAAEVGR